MKAGGIGGFEVQPVYPLALDGEIPGLKNVPFLSPEFLDMLKFTAAEAKAQGMRMDLTLGSGWPYGGPMFSAGEGPARCGFATRWPATGEPSVALPALRAGENLMAAFMGPAPGAEAMTDTYREFYQPMEIRASAWLPKRVKGPAPVVFFIASHTGMKVKRAAVGAEGYVVDHYDAAAVQKFIREVAEPELAACGPNVPTSVFCDSLEVFNTDWTPKLLDEFKRRRGYDLTPYLPALVSDSGPKTGRHPPRLGQDADGGLHRQLRRPDPDVGGEPWHPVPDPGLRHAPGGALQLRGRAGLPEGEGTDGRASGRCGGPPPRAISWAGRSLPARPGPGCIGRSSGRARST